MTTRTTKRNTAGARPRAQAVQSAPAAPAPVGLSESEQEDAPETTPSAAQVDAMEAFFEAADAVNLDEVVPEPIHVPLKEYVDYTVEDPDTHQPLRRRKLRQRMAEIETHVPLDVFDKMLASRKTMRAQQLAAHSDEERGRVAVAWMLHFVLDVWQLTEPDTTEQTLRLGLSFAQIQGLFGRFFGREMRRLTSRVENDATGTSANGSSATRG